MKYGERGIWRPRKQYSDWFSPTLSHTAEMKDFEPQKPPFRSRCYGSCPARIGRWCHKRDSNPRPCPYEGTALPAELLRLIACSFTHGGRSVQAETKGPVSRHGVPLMRQFAQGQTGQDQLRRHPKRHAQVRRSGRPPNQTHQACSKVLVRAQNTR